MRAPMTIDEHDPPGARSGDERTIRGDEANRHRAQAKLVFDPEDGTPEGNRPVSNMPVDSSRLFEQALEQTRMAVTLTDPHAPDNPLIFVNKAFETLTGYDRREAIGRNCRFLQTERTNEDELDKLRKAMAERETIVVEVENRRKDGAVFTNALHVGPIYDENGSLTHYYGSQWNISELVSKRAEVELGAAVAQELQHRIGNLFAVVISILRLSGRGETDVKSALDKASERIGALARAHEATLSGAGSSGGPILLHDLVETVMNPYRLNERGRIVLGGSRVELPPRAVTPLGLTLHELATNAVKYGALDHLDGRVLVEWTLGDRLQLVWDEDGGRPVIDPSEGTGTGTRILKGVLAAVGATIDTDWRERGVRVTITMPLDAEPERT